jgi:hypothetical protein
MGQEPTSNLKNSGRAICNGKETKVVRGEFLDLNGPVLVSRDVNIW